jgi:tetratricopeptide (TPR) repeat protein
MEDLSCINDCPCGKKGGRVCECGLYQYCSRACQKDKWKGHKATHVKAMELQFSEERKRVELYYRNLISCTPCTNCGKRSKKKCPMGCKCYYCSESCQRQDWPNHKKRCQSNASKSNKRAFARGPTGVLAVMTWLAKESGDDAAYAAYGIRLASVLNHMGYCEEALQVVTELVNVVPVVKSSALGEMGKSHFLIGNLFQAVNCFENALKDYQLPTGSNTELRELTEAYSQVQYEIRFASADKADQKQKQTDIPSLLCDLKKHESFGNHTARVRVHLCLCRVYLKKKNTPYAIHHSTFAYNIAKERNSKEEMLKAINLLVASLKCSAPLASVDTVNTMYEQMRMLSLEAIAITSELGDSRGQNNAQLLLTSLRDVAGGAL